MFVYNLLNGKVTILIIYRTSSENEHFQRRCIFVAGVAALRRFDVRQHDTHKRGHGTVKVWRMPRSRKSQWTKKINLWE